MASLPKRGGKTRALPKEDYSQKGAIFLQQKARFDSLVALTDSDERARAIIEAMESIEGDYENLRGVDGVVALAALVATIECWKRMGKSWRMAITPG
mgnify:CR=1 FL=1